jgi:HK97 family phage portal protein
MKLLGFELTRVVKENVGEAKANIFGDALMRIIAAQTGTYEAVNPENCMESPTVHAIVTAISRRFAVTPFHVYQKTTKNGLAAKEKLPNHPVAKLLAYPNSFQSRVDYWQDAGSWIARYGRYYAYKSRGSTGPIRELIPLTPRYVTPKLDPSTWRATFEWNAGQNMEVYPSSKIHHVRGPARDGIKGDSPVQDVAQSIALEIAAEKFGASFFSNGAIPLMVFKYMSGMQPFKDLEKEKEFIQSFQDLFSGNRRHRAMLLPKGIETGDPIKVENDKAQMLETRKYQRTVIAGAWGVPPHLVGDLERATFNNVEQQDGDFTLNVIMPYAQAFEASMERDLLTDDDVNNGIIIRANLDSILRADFKSRQEGLQIQRQNGALSPNEWREIEGRNPISADDGGDEYIRPANMVVAGEPVPNPQGQGNEANANRIP